MSQTDVEDPEAAGGEEPEPEEGGAPEGEAEEGEAGEGEAGEGEAGEGESGEGEAAEGEDVAESPSSRTGRLIVELPDDTQFVWFDINQIVQFLGGFYKIVFEYFTKGSRLTMDDIMHQREVFINHITNVTMASVLGNVFTRAERGMYKTRYFGPVSVEFLESIEANCSDLEAVIKELQAGIMSLTEFMSTAEETPDDVINYVQTLRYREQQAQLILILTNKFLSKKDNTGFDDLMLDKQVVESILRDQNAYIEKLKEYIDDVKNNVDEESEILLQWSDLSAEYENVSIKREDTMVNVQNLINNYLNQDEENADPLLLLSVRRELDSGLQAHNEYIAKLRQFEITLSDYTAPRDDRNLLIAEGDELETRVEQWALVNGIEVSMNSKEDVGSSVAKNAAIQLEELIGQLSAELEEPNPLEILVDADVLDWLNNRENRNEKLSFMIEKLNRHLELLRQSLVEGTQEKKESKRFPRPRDGIPDMSMLPDSLVELKEMCIDLMKKNNCLKKVYQLELNVLEEKFRMNKLKDEIAKLVASKMARQKGVMFEKQLQCAHDTIAELKEKLRENKKNAKTVKEKATRKVMEIQEKLNEVLRAQEEAKLVE